MDNDEEGSTRHPEKSEREQGRHSKNAAVVATNDVNVYDTVQDENSSACDSPVYQLRRGTRGL